MGRGPGFESCVRHSVRTGTVGELLYWYQTQGWGPTLRGEECTTMTSQEYLIISYLRRSLLVQRPAYLIVRGPSIESGMRHSIRTRTSRELLQGGLMRSRMTLVVVHITNLSPPYDLVSEYPVGLHSYFLVTVRYSTRFFIS